jgi:outer membrane protein TolC
MIESHLHPVFSGTRSFLLFSVLLVFPFGKAISQPLSLWEALQKARSNSPVSKQIRSRFLSEEWKFKSNKALLKPQLDLDAEIPGFTRAINQISQPDGSILFRPQSQNYSSTQLSLGQNILATGGNISLNSGLSRIDLFENQGNSPKYYWLSSPLALTYVQPLFRINQIKWNWQQQQISFDEASRMQFEQLEDLNIQVTQKFFELLISQVQLQNAESNLHNNDTIFRISQGRFGIGKIAENELLQVELGLMKARNAVEQSKVKKLTSEKELRNLMGEFESSSAFSPELPKKIPRPIIDPEQAQLAARQNRSDYKTLEMNENMAKMNLQSRKISRRFTADLNFSVGFNQTASNFGDAFKNLQSRQSASVGINVPLQNGGRNKALVKQAEYELDATLEYIKNEKNKIDIQVFNQVMELRQLQASLDISAKADTIAQRRYEMAKNRYLIGKTDITNLVIAQGEKDDAVLDYVQTLQQYWMAWFVLRRVTLYDFEASKKVGLE